MIKAEYIGSDAARIDGELFHDRRGTGVMPRAARMLIEAGRDPAELVVVLRAGKPVFAQPYSLGHWAKRSVKEDGEFGMELVPHRPFGDSDRCRLRSQKRRAARSAARCC